MRLCIKVTPLLPHGQPILQYARDLCVKCRLNLVGLGYAGPSILYSGSPHSQSSPRQPPPSIQRLTIIHSKISDVYWEHHRTDQPMQVGEIIILHPSDQPHSFPTSGLWVLPEIIGQIWGEDPGQVSQRPPQHQDGADYHWTLTRTLPPPAPDISKPGQFSFWKNPSQYPWNPTTAHIPAQCHLLPLVQAVLRAEQGANQIYEVLCMLEHGNFWTVIEDRYMIIKYNDTAYKNLATTIPSHPKSVSASASKHPEDAAVGTPKGDRVSV